MVYLFNLVTGEWGVGGHEEVTSRCWDQRRDDADKVIVHVARVSQCLCARSYHSRDLANMETGVSSI